MMQSVIDRLKLQDLIRRQGMANILDELVAWTAKSPIAPENTTLVQLQESKVRKLREAADFVRQPVLEPRDNTAAP